MKQFLIFLILSTSLVAQDLMPLKERLTSEDIKTAWTAMNEIKSKDLDGYDSLIIPFLSHENAKVAGLACTLLAGKLGKEGEDHLIALLQDERQGVKRSALLALIAYHDPDMSLIFEEELQRGTTAVRLIALGGLYDLGIMEETAPIISSLKEKSLDAVLTALQVVAAVRERTPFKQTVLSLLTETRDEVRGEAARVLALLEGEDVRNALKELAIREGYHYVRISAIDSLLKSSDVLDSAILELLTNPRTGSWCGKRITELELTEKFLPDLVKKLKSEEAVSADLLKVAFFFDTPELNKLISSTICNSKSEEIITAGLQYSIESKRDLLDKRCIKALFKSSVPTVVSYTCWYAGAFKKMEFEKQIRKLIESEDPIILGGAVWAAGDMELKDLTDRARELTTHPDTALQSYARESLKKLEK